MLTRRNLFTAIAAAACAPLAKWLPKGEATPLWLMTYDTGPIGIPMWTLNHIASISGEFHIPPAGKGSQFRLTAVAPCDVYEHGRKVFSLVAGEGVHLEWLEDGDYASANILTVGIMERYGFGGGSDATS